MRKAYAINTYDVSKIEAINTLLDVLADSKINDTEEDSILIHKYVYNHLRKCLNTNNILQLARTKYDDDIVLIEYDVSVNEKVSNEPKQDENGYYLEVIE